MPCRFVVVGLVAMLLAAAPAHAQLSIAQVTAIQSSALRGIEQDTQQRVAVLHRRLAGLDEGPARRALERQIMQTKMDGRVALLRAQLQFAREPGDALRAVEIERALAPLVNPRPRAAASAGSNTKQAPSPPPVASEVRRDR